MTETTRSRAEDETESEITAEQAELDEAEELVLPTKYEFVPGSGYDYRSRPGDVSVAAAGLSLETALGLVAARPAELSVFASSILSQHEGNRALAAVQAVREIEAGVAALRALGHDISVSEVGPTHLERRSGPPVTEAGNGEEERPR